MRWILSILPVIAAMGCGQPYTELSGATMGTHYRVVAQCPEPPARSTIERELERVTRAMSTYESGSTLSLFNRSVSGEWFPVGADLAVVIDAALELSALSDGAFDITVGPLVDLWGFGPKTQAGAPSATEIAEARARVGYRALHVRAMPPALRKDRPLTLDLSAIAKGFAVDRVHESLAAAGCANLLVEIGGELFGRGVNRHGQRWRIGVETPDASGAVESVIEIDGVAVATSGDYRNFREIDGVRVSHTIDPRTGYPVRHGLASVTVVAPQAMLADGLATLISVLGPDEGLSFALEHEVAALLLVRAGNGFEKRATPAFERVMRN